MTLIHPAETAARKRLEALPGLSWALEKTAKHAYEKLVRAAESAAAVHVTSVTLEKLHALALDIGNRLDTRAPDLFVRPGVPGGLRLVGREQPLAVLDARLLASAPEEEVRVWLGRAAAPGLSDGWGWWTVADFLDAAWKTLGPAALPLAGLRWAVEDWRRAAELSADRVGALAAGGLDPVRQALTRPLTGGLEKWGQVNPTAIGAQAATFAELTEGWSLGRLRRIGLALGGGAPWIALRLAELDRWEKSGGYTHAATGAGDPPGETEPPDTGKADPFAEGPALWGAFFGLDPDAAATPPDDANADTPCFCHRQQDWIKRGMTDASDIAARGMDAVNKGLSAFFGALRE